MTQREVLTVLAQTFHCSRCPFSPQLSQMALTFYLPLVDLTFDLPWSRQVLDFPLQIEHQELDFLSDPHERSALVTRPRYRNNRQQHDVLSVLQHRFIKREKEH